MEEITYIYSLEDPRKNKPRYIGKTVNVKKRLCAHIRRAKNKGNSTYKDNWIRKLLSEGVEPVLVIVDKVEGKQSNFWEQHYISLYKSWGFSLTNGTDGGDGGSTMLGVKQTKETVEKRTNTRRNNGRPWVSEEQKVKMRNNNLGGKNPSWGLKRSDEVKLKMSEGMKGKTKNYSEEGLERKRLFMKEHPPRKGKHCTKEHKNKLSQVRSGKKLSNETCKKMSLCRMKKVKQYDLNNNFIKEWDSMKAISDFFNCDFLSHRSH